MKTITCGIILTNGNQFLIVKPTGGNYWSIPKGLVDENESLEQAALREFYEEVGIQLSNESLQFLGQHKYLKDKDIAIFLKIQSILPVIHEMKCLSFFTNSLGKTIPEVCKWKYINFSDSSTYLNKNLAIVLQPIIDNILSK